MSVWTRGRPSPALVVAMTALVAALAGSAVALPGSNTVTSGDIRKKAVKSSDLATEAVKSKDIGDGQVEAQDLADAEPFHAVGDAGEPPFSDGGEGDCEWGPTGTTLTGLNPVAFYKDPLDVVQLVGATASSDNTGGDGACNSGDSGQVEDAIVFILPAGYRPENITIVGLAGGEAIVVGDGGATINGENVSAGAVVAAGDSGALATLDGASFRAEGDGTDPIQAPGRAVVRSLGAIAR